MPQDEIIIEEVIRYAESGQLSPALMIEASKALELRRISVALREIADHGITVFNE